MTVDEILRRIVRAHLWVILLCVAVPVAGVLGLTMTSEPEYVGTVRLQVSSTAPATTTEADAISSRVLALASTPRLVDEALADAGIDRDADEVAQNAVTTRRLGQSAVVELSVRDRDRDAASRITVALAERVVAFINEGGRAEFEDMLRQTNRDLEAARSERNSLAQKLLDTTDSTERAELRIRLDDAQATVDRLATDRGSLLLAQAGVDQVVPVDLEDPYVERAPTGTVPRTALALLLGLMVGIAVAVALETLRPHVAGTRALARMLSAPVLGSTNDRPSSLVNSMTIAARRQGLETVVLVGVDESDDHTVQQLLEDLPSSPRARRSATARTTRARPYRSENEDRVEGDLGIPEGVRFTDLVGVDREDELTSGVVVLTSGTPQQRQVDALDDVLRTVRWPVIGLVSTSRTPRWSRR